MKVSASFFSILIIVVDFLCSFDKVMDLGIDRISFFLRYGKPALVGSFQSLVACGCEPLSVEHFHFNPLPVFHHFSIKAN